MSIKCQNWVYQHSEARGNDRLVLLAIADEANDDGTNAHPGIKTIAHKARENIRTTMRCIDRLEAADRLIVCRPAIKGRGHFNTYVVVMEEPPKNPDTVTPLAPDDPAAIEQSIPSIPDTVTPLADLKEKVTQHRERPRKTAPAYLIGNRPTDPGTSKPPLPPAERGESPQRATPRANGSSPRSRGSNPRGPKPPTAADAQLAFVRRKPCGACGTTEGMLFDEATGLAKPCPACNSRPHLSTSASSPVDDLDIPSPL